ncbi:MAG: hypothetical protein RL637_283 [Pseudomonadota bacterium]|jgi:protein NirF
MFAIILGLSFIFSATANAADSRATGDLGVVIERASGSALIVEHSHHQLLAKINELGDLSHVSVVFSRDQHYAYIFGRDGGLSKIDLIEDEINQRIIQAGNSIGGAISQDGKLIAVSNYEPGGIKIFSSEDLHLIADIPASYGEGKLSKTVGLVDAPHQQLVVSLFDAGEIWLINLQNPMQPQIQKFKNIGKQPYDGFLTQDGRYYIAGLFGESGLALLDLWNPQLGVKRILTDYGQHEPELPVYKMPHLEGWSTTGEWLFIPALHQQEVWVINRHNWQLHQRIKMAGQPVFVSAQPDGQQIWVNFAFPNNHLVQIIDVANLTVKKTLTVGKAVLHFEFTPKGEQIWMAVRDDNLVKIYDTLTFTQIAELAADKPNGIFFSHRAYKIGF